MNSSACFRQVSAAALIVVLWGRSEALAEVRLTSRQDIFIFENPRVRIEVDAAAGGRIRSWLLKPDKRDLIALWKGKQEIGGALDDRAFFTAARYRAAIVQQGPEKATLRLEASHVSGLGVVRLLTLSGDSPDLRVDYEFRNGTQAVKRLFVRCFFLPGTKPQTEGHLYWVHGKGARDDATAIQTPDAHGYYVPSEPAYAALWDGDTGDGIMVYAPGVSKFYFWRGSKQFPTFEWIYEDVPHGKVLRTALVLAPIQGEREAPDWGQMAADRAGQGRPPSLTPLKGWVDEAERFAVTAAERARGFWLSVGEDDAKQRMTAPLELDLAREDGRYASISLNTTRDFAADLAVNVPERYKGQVVPFLEVDGDDRRELLPLPAAGVRLTAGGRRRIWLRVTSTGLPDGDSPIRCELRVGDASRPLTVAVRVWPLTLTAEPRPFHVRGYCGGFPVWTQGYDVTEAGLRQLEGVLRAYAEIGGDVLDWNGVWARILRHVRIAGTDQAITEVAKRDPESIDLARLPKLDFSYFDPWFEAARRHGVTRVESYMSHPDNAQLSWRLFDPAVGKGRVRPGSSEGERVLIWFYREMKRAFAERGFEGFFCKISDEIYPEHIPAHVATAKIVRKAGWRPFTTITGMIARTAAHIRAMNPYCDQWQLAFGLKDDFLALTRQPFRLRTEVHPLAGKWGRYTNGGARDTWAMRVFGEGGSVGIAPDMVESFDLREDGVSLRIKGGSPWGNRDRGVVVTAGRLGAYLYVSPVSGGPEEHQYELTLTLREPGANGEPLVRVDPSDEIWCYGGGSRPFRGTYHRAWTYPLMTLQHGFAGYGLWAFYHWNRTERIMWIDKDTGEVTLSPAYCGYRDGWRDARLLARLRDRTGEETLAAILGSGKGAALQVGYASREVYRYSTVLNATDPGARNGARRRALRALTAR